jgi:putative oxidoreductase
MLDRLARTSAPAAVVLVRIAVGWIFLSEGIQKFLYPDLLGAGRFARIGIPLPQQMGPFVGGVEIVCGGLVLVGLFTRAAALLLLADISVAILSTKVPVLLGHGYWIFSRPSVARYGFWGMSSEIRTDLAMFLGTWFLVIVGAGPVSADRLLFRTPGRGSLR